MTSLAELTSGRFDAALFDLDGVLTATAKLHAAAWKRTFDAEPPVANDPPHPGWRDRSRIDVHEHIRHSDALVRTCSVSITATDVNQSARVAVSLPRRLGIRKNHFWSQRPKR
jgi:beta-phosphoglucomutase-like phosphatase (HAD superfamily)